MLEAVLFGHEKGAFTGATNARAGKFEQAQGGTLLLDEISEMDLGLQAKLLRVLQERELERLGGQKTIALDVRVLATTNRDLRSYVDEGKFREDLFYRLNVFPMALPPLRERRGDIVPLVRHALARSGGNVAGIELTPAAEHSLTAHDWPGNVRELDNLIQRTLIMLSGETIDARDLCFEAPTGAAPAVSATPAESAGDGASALRSDLRSKEEALILAALSAGNGSRKAAAERLGISPRTLRYKIARLRDAGITIPGTVGAEFA
jgi:two-component system response regulator FlrC